MIPPPATPVCLVAVSSTSSPFDFPLDISAVGCNFPPDLPSSPPAPPSPPPPMPMPTPTVTTPSSSLKDTYRDRERERERDVQVRCSIAPSQCFAPRSDILGGSFVLNSRFRCRCQYRCRCRCRCRYHCLFPCLCHWFVNNFEPVKILLLSLSLLLFDHAMVTTFHSLIYLYVGAIGICSACSRGYDSFAAPNHHSTSAIPPSATADI